MIKHLVVAAGLLALPAAALAQNKAPEGAAVGAGAGAVGGAIVGGLAGSTQKEFHTYVVEQRHPAYTWDGKVVVGGTLPETGVTYYTVPEKYGVKTYRYTVVNDRVVLVDPATRRIVQIVE